MAKKLAHLVEYLRIYWTDFHSLFTSGDDGATSSKNLANFCLVTPDIMELICVPMYLYWAKIDLTPAFVVLLCRNATEYCYADGCINSSNDQATSDKFGRLMIGISSLHEWTVYNRRRSALGLVYLRSLSGSTVIFSYCLLGGDTAVPSRLLARFATQSSFFTFVYFFTMSKAILVSTGLIITIFSPNGRYLREIFSIRSSFSDSSRDVAISTNFVAKLWQNKWLCYRRGTARRACQ